MCCNGRSQLHTKNDSGHMCVHAACHACQCKSLAIQYIHGYQAYATLTQSNVHRPVVQSCSEASSTAADHLYFGCHRLAGMCAADTGKCTNCYHSSMTQALKGMHVWSGCMSGAVRFSSVHAVCVAPACRTITQHLRCAVLTNNCSQQLAASPKRHCTHIRVTLWGGPGKQHCTGPPPNVAHTRNTLWPATAPLQVALTSKRAL